MITLKSSLPYFFHFLNDFRVKGTIGDLTLRGSPLDTIFQKIVESYKDEEEAVVNHLLDFNIEKNSLEGECDIKLNVASRSLQFVHDAVSKNQMLKCVLSWFT